MNPNIEKEYTAQMEEAARPEHPGKGPRDPRLFRGSEMRLLEQQVLDGLVGQAPFPLAPDGHFSSGKDFIGRKQRDPGGTESPFCFGTSDIRHLYPAGILP